MPAWDITDQRSTSRDLLCMLSWIILLDHTRIYLELIWSETALRSGFRSALSPFTPSHLKSQLCKGHVFLPGNDPAQFALCFHSKISWKRPIVNFSSWTLHTSSEDLIKNSWTTMLRMQNERGRLWTWELSLHIVRGERLQGGLVFSNWSAGGTSRPLTLCVQQ